VVFAAEKLGRVSLKNITKRDPRLRDRPPDVECDPNRAGPPILPDKEEKIAGSVERAENGG
jgi:hypothetical protein